MVAGESGRHTFRLWNNATGQQVGASTQISGTGPGWIQAQLATPIRIQPDVLYTIAITTGGDARRNYPALTNALGGPSNNGSSLSYPANAGVFGMALSQRPTQAWKATNYLRDMVFDPD